MRKYLGRTQTELLRRKWRDVTYGQVWWPILGICALHLTHPTCTHTAVNTHTPWTHTRSSGQPFMLQRPGSSWGSVPCSRAPQSWYWGWRECSTFTPPTYNSCRPETRTHNLWPLTIRPRLPIRKCIIQCVLNMYQALYEGFLKTRKIQ